MAVEVEGKAGARVEEIPCGVVVEIVLEVIVIYTLHFQGDTTILQVHVCRQPVGRSVLGADEDIDLLLQTVVVVPGAGIVERIVVIAVAQNAVPEHFAEMVAAVAGNVHAAGK